MLPPRSISTPNSSPQRSDRWCRALLAVLAVTSFATSGHSAPQDWRRAERLKILPYPCEDEVAESFFSSEGFQVSPLDTDDINQDFSNIDDLAWLQPLVRESRVVLLGETHYFQYIHHLRNRFVFALNTFDRYPTVMLERQYSFSPFLDHYVGLTEEEAAEFERANRGLFLNGFTVDFQFLEHVRRWNATHPEKRISVGCYDIEHDACLTIEQILRPYRCQAGAGGEPTDGGPECSGGPERRRSDFRRSMQMLVRRSGRRLAAHQSGPRFGERRQRGGEVSIPDHGVH